MAFDPNLPANHAPIVSQELRDQFNALKALIDAQQTQITALQSQSDGLQAQITAMPAELGGAKNVDDFFYGADDISNPPQTIEVQDIQAGLVALVNALKH